jgi:glycine cleavage system H protein
VTTPNDRKYTKTHEWIKIEGGDATVGLTEFAVHAIKDIVFLELPEAGKNAEAGKPFGVIESVKAVFDLNSPLSGRIADVNAPLLSDYDTLVADPYTKGWLMKLNGVSGEQGHLLDAAAYDKFCAEDHH